MKTLLKEARELFLQGKVATLATLLDGHPYASLVTYAPTPDERGALLLISRLAIHTQNLLKDKRVSLFVAESLTAQDQDPQTLARACLMGEASLVAREDADYAALAAAFGARNKANHLFAMRDFELFRLSIHEVRYVGGFGRIVTIPGEAWQE
jgi:putative heme iron utilization protein